MLHRYVVGGCSNVRSSENGTALHTIPFYGSERLEAKKRRKRWIDFVRQKPEKRAGWDPSKSLVICTKHFKADDFVRNCTLITEKQTQSVQLFSCVTVSGLPLTPLFMRWNYRRGTTLERWRLKNDNIFRLCLSSLLAFLVSF